MSKKNLLFFAVTALSLLGGHVMAESNYTCDDPLDHDVFQLGHEAKITITAQKSNTYGYHKIKFSSNAGLYAGSTVVGWCVDVDREISKKSYRVDTYSSYDTASIPAGAVDKPQNLDLLNWLINEYALGDVVSPGNGCPPTALTWKEMQKSIWTIIDDANVTDFTGVEQCIVDHIVDDTLANGENFQPCCDSDEKIAILMVVDNSAGEILKQVIIGEILLDDYYCTATSPPSGTVFGDPHFTTWAGEMYDFHGICDLVLLHNPSFNNGVGMDIHLRTHQTRQWSYVSAAAVRIGNETLEVMGGSKDLFWINGIGVDQFIASDDVVTTISSYPIIFRSPNDKSREYEIDLGGEDSILLQTWHDMVRVNIKHATEENFAGSLGLLGNYPKGELIGRDNTSIFQNKNAFGQEWQVLVSEPKLFHTSDGPQAPTQCEIPSKSVLRRRLAASNLNIEAATNACNHIHDLDEFNHCVFDVIAMNDKNVAHAY